MYNLSIEKQEVLDATGHTLVLGGPGSGKTTIALLKAQHIIDSGILNREQKILFLSFARATISRVEQHARNVLGMLNRANIEIATYHSFAWAILKSHGYLLIGQRVRLLPPHEATVRLSGKKGNEKAKEKERLFAEEGLLHFDLFASKCAELFRKSRALLKIFFNAYPIIILDEFQDTNKAEWDFISLLGDNSTMIALADPDQRIYDFKGADPKRIDQFIKRFNPQIFNFETENNRSNGTDIVSFGNDILTGSNKGKKYSNVNIHTYRPFKEYRHLVNLKIHILKRINANTNNPGWSLAILTPSNDLMLAISYFLSQKQKMNDGKYLPVVHHEVAIETAGPTISAILIAKLMEGGSQKICSIDSIVTALCKHILGRRGDNKPVPETDQKLANALMDYIKNGDMQTPIRGKVRQQIIDECRKVSETCNKKEFTGDVAADWIFVRDLFFDKRTDCIRRIGDDAMYIKLMRKGSILNSSLGRLWKENGNYKGASEVVKNAIVQEYFASGTRTWEGINVMTIHKAKGKEFDEVIIYDGAFNGQRIVYKNDVDKARRLLRVAVTRARNNVIILTPQHSPCCLL